MSIQYHIILHNTARSGHSFVKRPWFTDKTIFLKDFNQNYKSSK